MRSAKKTPVETLSTLKKKNVFKPDISVIKEKRFFHGKQPRHRSYISIMTLPSTQTGYGFQRGNRKLVKYESIPVKQPGDNQVLLKVEAAGMCSSDNHILIAQEQGTADEFIMGHEIAGQLVNVGSKIDTKTYPIGGRFAIFISRACGICKNCRKGKDNQCVGPGSSQGFGITTDGGYQEYLLVDNLRCLVPIPDNVSYEIAAVATDSVLTPFHAISKVRHLLGPTSKVLVVGLGGLGLNAVQILKSFGCYVVGTDIKQEVAKVAIESGANEFHTDLHKSNIEESSFDVSFDFCGYDASHKVCSDFTAKGGKIMMVGLGKARVKVQHYHLARREIDLIYSFGGYSQELSEVFQWISLGKIKPIATLADMSKLPEYLDKLGKGQVSGRMVFKPKL